MSTSFTPYSYHTPIRPIIVYGPQGCGKTANRHALAAYLNRLHIVDGWSGSTNVPANSILLTDDAHFASADRWKGRYDLPSLAVIQFDDVKPHLLAETKVESRDSTLVTGTGNGVAKIVERPTDIA